MTQGNILINDEWQACLADFGLARVSDLTVGTHTSNHHGSTRWMAPELHDPDAFGLGRFLRTPESDVYAFACVCMEVGQRRVHWNMFAYFWIGLYGERAIRRDIK